ATPGRSPESRPSTPLDAPRARRPVTVTTTASTANTVTFAARRDMGSRGIVFTSRSWHQVEIARGASQHDRNLAIAERGDHVTFGQRLNARPHVAEVDGAARALKIDAASERRTEPQRHITGIRAHIRPRHARVEV